jgi:alkaline phosphatase D
MTEKNVQQDVNSFLNASLEDPSFVFIGGDFDHRNPQSLSSKRKMFKELYNESSKGLYHFINGILRQMPMVHHWDDHDAGGNNLDKTYRDWDISRRVFQEYVPAYPLPADSYGIWQRFRYAHVDFFVLDCRSQRDPDTDPDDAKKSMLDGNAVGSYGQFEWLKEGLLSSSAPWKIIFSSVAVNPTAKPNDGWAVFQTEWSQIRQFIDDNHITGVVVLSGDLHIGGLDDGRASGVPEMMVPPANMNGCGTGKLGNWSEGTYHNTSSPCNGYGVVTVLTHPHRLLLEVKDEQGNARLAYTVGQ